MLNLYSSQCAPDLRWMLKRVQHDDFTQTGCGFRSNGRRASVNLALRPHPPMFAAMTLRSWPLVLCLCLSACATKAPPLAAPIAAPPPPPPGLAQLINTDAAAVTRLLGAASLDRSEGAARALQFVRPPCILDVFLYPPTPGAPPRVRTAAARKPDGSRIDPGACLAMIVPVSR